MSLDREIEDLLAVDPSPEFLAKVRQRIASEPAPSTSLFTPGPQGPGLRRPWTLVPLGAVAVAITLGVALWPSSVPVMKPVAPTSEGAFATAPTTDSARAPVAPAPNRAIAPIAPTNEVAIAPALALREAEILLSAAESRAIANLLERVQSGRMTPVTQSEDGQTSEPSWVDIEPVVIAPLARIAPVEGDRQ